MKIALVAAIAAVLLLAACGGAGRAVDDTNPGSSSSGPPKPTEIPAADGPVRTRSLATVMDAGGPELCLGPVAESYPPQCGGPPIANWDWSAGYTHQAFDRQGDIRWGQFAVTGTFDGSSFEVTDAIPAALYDVPAEEPAPGAAPARDHSEAELAAIAEEVGGLPGAQGAFTNEGRVTVDVVYDDGSLQDWADRAYGRDVVVVVSALVPAG